MIEFEINGAEYRAEKLDVFKQAHISKRIAPLLPTLIPVFIEISKAEEESRKNNNKKEPGSILPMLQPLADALAELPDETVEYVIANCLAVVKRRQGDHWATVWNANAKRAMFEDLNDLSALLPIVIRVIQGSLGNFIQGFLTSQKEPSEAQA